MSLFMWEVFLRGYTCNCLFSPQMVSGKKFPPVLASPSPPPQESCSLAGVSPVQPQVQKCPNTFDLFLILRFLPELGKRKDAFPNPAFLREVKILLKFHLIVISLSASCKKVAPVPTSSLLQLSALF